MEHSTPAGNRDSGFDFRLLAALLLLVPSVFFTWRTWNDLGARRDLRTNLAEISHARYGLFDAGQWVAQILPIINLLFVVFDLTSGNQASLRPMAERALYRLLDQVKEQMAPKLGSGGGFAAQAMGAMVKSMIDGLRPKVPEFANTVLKELGSKDNKEAIKKYIAGMIADGAKNTFSPVDRTEYSRILTQYGCADGAACHGVIGAHIEDANRRISREYMAALGSAAIALILLLWQRKRLSRVGVALAILICLTLLAGGVLSPMLEVDARISRIDMTFFGQPLTFGDQVLYYQSKTVLEVYHTLIDIGQPEMYLVAVLLLTFSVIITAQKKVTLDACLIWPDWLTRSRIAHFFALESSKWSMADVMAIAIFMSFVAFNGVISGALGGLKRPGSQIVIPTDSSQVLAGFYLFIGFVLSSLFLSRKLERDLRTAYRSDTG